MILRLDGVQVNLPPPSEPDPAGAGAVQELLGGKFAATTSSMSTRWSTTQLRATCSCVAVSTRSHTHGRSST
jgi:manganese catalase